MKGRLQESPLKHVHAFSSISADVGNAGQSNYAAANGALSAMMRSSAQEVSPAAPSLQLSAPLLAGNLRAFIKCDAVNPEAHMVG